MNDFMMERCPICERAKGINGAWVPLPPGSFSPSPGTVLAVVRCPDCELLLAAGPLPREAYEAKAKLVWALLDKNERTGIRFGLFPAPVMKVLASHGFTDERLMACALMEVAKQNGGTIA